jgi:hypothetical protein
LKGSSWKSHVSLIEAGSALERTNRFTETLSFYEMLARADPTEREKEFVRARWLISKQRQLDHERARRSKRTQTVAQELEDGKASWGFKDLRGIPEYPDPGELIWPPAQADGAAKELQSVAVTEELPDHVPMQFGPFTLALSRKNGRCNVTHAATMEMAWIKINDQQCGGEPGFSMSDDGRWNCPSWGLAVSFPKRGLLVLELRTLGVRLEVVSAPGNS